MHDRWSGYHIAYIYLCRCMYIMHIKVYTCITTVTLYRCIMDGQAITLCIFGSYLCDIVLS